MNHGKDFTTMELFSGAGGGILASRILGHKPLVAIEWDAYCCQVLRERVAEGCFTGMQVREGDIRLQDTSEWHGRISCINAGFPCTDISVAGNQAGIGEGTRSGLYKEVLRIADEVRPEYIFLENVAAIVTGASGEWLRTIIGDLAERGYSACWCTLSAAEIGAAHKRNRWWLLAWRDNGEKKISKSTKMQELQQDISTKSRLGESRDGYFLRHGMLCRIKTRQQIKRFGNSCDVSNRVDYEAGCAENWDGLEVGTEKGSRCWCCNQPTQTSKSRKAKYERKKGLSVGGRKEVWEKNKKRGVHSPFKPGLHRQRSEQSAYDGATRSCESTPSATGSSLKSDKKWGDSVQREENEVRECDRFVNVYPLPKLVLPTSETGGGSWATPNTMDVLPPKSEKSLHREMTVTRPGRSRPANLRDQVSNMDMWATPQARDYRTGDNPEGKRAKRKIEQGWTQNLNDQVRMWPTPSASDNRDRGNAATPAIHRRIAKGKQVMLSMMVSETSDRLNPKFVEWLMMWPIGYTICRKFKKKRRK